MVKLRNSTASRFSLFSLTLVLGLTAGLGCGGAQIVPTSDGSSTGAGRAGQVSIENTMSSVVSNTQLNATQLWSHKVPGLMTDLAISRDGSAVIVATIPNPDAVSGPKETGRGLTRFDKKGKKLWRISLEGTVKSLALSGNGKLALVSTYDNWLSAIDVRGKIVWKVEGICRPISVGPRVLCYHDDDAEPGVAFDLYSDRGKKILSYPITRDVLALKVSDDERNSAIAVEGGQLSLLGPDFKTVWDRKVSGEVLDVAVSTGAHPQVWVLFNSTPATDGAPKAQGQNIAVFNEEGKLVAEVKPTSRVEQLEAVPGANAASGYGNSPQGQFLGYYELARSSLIEKWSRVDRHSADFSSAMFVTHDFVLIGHESIAGKTRQSHLMTYDADGGVKWDLPIQAEDGAYLYAHGLAQAPSIIAYGTDDSTLSAVQLKPSTSSSTNSVKRSARKK